MAMDETTYREWWPLHVRVACGESLSEEEQRVYERGLKALHDEEVGSRDADKLRQARMAVRELEQEHAELDARRRQLDDEILALERLISPPRQLSSVGR